MTLKTRTSTAIEKAQLRLALLKSIDEQLDLGHGLTIDTYSCLIDSTRAAVQAHNKLVSNLDESRQMLDQMDKNLSQLSERMLSGVATKYGRDSIEYAKAGGSSRKRNKPASSPVTPVAAGAKSPTASSATQNAITNGNSNSAGVIS